MSESIRISQKAVKQWIVSLFGQAALEDTKERSLRFAEEAIELVQAASQDITREELHRLVDYVYGRAPGEAPQEVGGVMVTLLGLAANLNLDVPEALVTELDRIFDPKMIETMRAKQKAKAEQGVGATYP